MTSAEPTTTAAGLEEVRLRGLGVIEDAVLPLGPGLTVLTGETGAGKTMVVQGLSLLFGGRADAGRVRPGAERAVVEGRLVLPVDHPALVRSEEAGAELDDGVLLVARSVGADGRSRAHLGGRAVPVGVLAELGEEVLALHGQSDQQRLLQPTRQREALDRFAGPELLALKERFGTAWARLRSVRGELAALQQQAADRTREAEQLRAGLSAVEELAPLAGEDVALVAELARLGHADALRTAASTAQQDLTGDEAGEGLDALQLLSHARRQLEVVAEHDAELASLAGRAREIGVLAADLAQDLASYAATVEADPMRLAAGQDRLAALTGLARRHDVEGADGLRAWASEASDRLLGLDRTDDDLAALATERDQLTKELGELAAALTAAREAAATRFGERVTAELQDLAMPHARVVARVSQRPDEGGLPVGDAVLRAGPEGVDDVELLLAAHPGAPERPLAKGASGGELSRVMLAVEVVFAGADPVPLMVFDEVDAGVGGAAAVEIGRRLARLSEKHQVVVVTHLPQVAAFADRHLHVVKDTDGATLTRGGVTVLEGEARVAELSRMLAGLDSGLARAHAEELLAQARASR